MTITDKKNELKSAIAELKANLVASERFRGEDLYEGLTEFTRGLLSKKEAELRELEKEKRRI